MPGTKHLISNLKSKILQPALTSHFEVEIPVGSSTELNSKLSSVLTNSSVDQERLNLFCFEASLPGSSMATFEVRNDRTGTTERFAHRRMYDDRMDFTFYVDAEKYFPIRFFEAWMRYISGEDNDSRTDESDKELSDTTYHYRMRYPDDNNEGYRCKDGLKVRKFERDYKSSLEYEFIGAYPIAISSIPVSYESSNLLKCTVSMSYIRYVMTEIVNK